MSNTKVMPIGKYKGRSLEEVSGDRKYVEWLLLQPWFRDGYKEFVELLEGLAEAPNNEETPDHNQFQALFLTDPTLVPRVLRAVGSPLSEFTIQFEAPVCKRQKNSYRSTVGYADVCISDGRGYMGVNIELKPSVGDDYPAILRKISEWVPTWNSGCEMMTLVLCREFQASIPFDVVQRMFKQSGVFFLRLSDV